MHTHIFSISVLTQFKCDGPKQLYRKLCDVVDVFYLSPIFLVSAMLISAMVRHYIRV